MQIQGEHLIHAPRERVWRLLNDPEVLARITPGVTSLVAEGDDRYKVTLAVSLGPLKSTLQGQIEIADKQPPDAMTLKVQVRGAAGGVAAVGRITLQDAAPSADSPTGAEIAATSADASASVSASTSDAAGAPGATAATAAATQASPAEAAAAAQASPAAAATRITWTGEPQLLGMLATVGGRLVQGAAKAQADQFFASLEREAAASA